MHERTEIEVAAGDKLLLMGNRKEPGFRATNGELTTVRSVERAIINLEDGRSVPANYREFTHGYAVTAHRSQGKTVDKVIISADVMKQELFYVAASRGREGIAIVTSDVECLGQSLGVSMARPCAIELANEISQSKQSLEHNAGMNPKQVIEALKPPRDMGFEQGIGLGFQPLNPAQNSLLPTGTNTGNIIRAVPSKLLQVYLCGGSETGKKAPMPTPSWMEPMLPSDGGRVLEDIAFDLISSSDALAGQIHPIVTESVGNLVRFDELLLLKPHRGSRHASA